MGLSTHVLDTARGKPAQGIAVTVKRELTPGLWEIAAQGVTDADGRVKPLLAEVHAGAYKLTFELDAYFAAQGQAAFYPQATVVFRVTQPGDHYHIPLLLSPFGYATYRGS